MSQASMQTTQGSGGQPPAGAGEAAGRVADTSKQQAAEVAHEVKHQTRNLLEEARSETTTQARNQRDRAVQSLRSLGGELNGMADRSDEGGMGAELARQSAQRVHAVAGFLEQREPGELLDEVRDYARRQPGVFLLGALAAGVLVGRLTKGVVSAHSDEDSDGEARMRAMARPTTTTYTTPRTTPVTTPGTGLVGDDLGEAGSTGRQGRPGINGPGVLTGDLP